MQSTEERRSSGSGSSGSSSKLSGSGGNTAPDRREMQMAALQFDLSTARPLKEIVLGEIKQGTDPKWIVVKYGHLGVTLERVLAAKGAMDKQAEAKREREEARTSAA